MPQRRRFARRGVSLAIGGAVLALATAAEATPCPSTAEGLRGVDSEVRLAFLADAFDSEVRAVDIWSWTWGGVYVAGTVAQAAFIPVTNDHGLRTDLAVGAISSGGGALLLLGLPLQITLPLRSVRRAWDDTDRCALLARAEKALEKGASDQKFSSGIVPHLGNVLVNVGIGLVLGLGYGRWQSAAISAGVGIAVGEANAFTQPHHLPGALERYRSGHLATQANPGLFSLVPWTDHGAWGMSLAFTR